MGENLGKELGFADASFGARGVSKHSRWFGGVPWVM